MTPEAQRIAIAKACGWAQIKLRLKKDYDTVWSGVIPNAGEFDSQGALENAFELPDYLNDLNAMNEAEKTLVPNSHEEQMYWGSLGWNFDMTVADARNLGHATAAQRAEAFLRAIGKWVE